MKLHKFAALALGAATAALAGPPYLTDDPVPTDQGHWEVYTFFSGVGRSSVLDADGGFDVNFGAFKDVQLTATLPLGFSHEPGEDRKIGLEDLEFGIKYRFIDDIKTGVSVAIFPRAILPTSDFEGHEKTSFLFPIWIEKDFKGGTSLFGGGGFEFNPGQGNRNFWQAGVAVTHDVNDTLSLGAEAAWQQPDAIDGTGQKSLGVGSIIKLSKHHALLFSGGPSWADHRRGYHFYTSLGLFF